jgi:hypothetical protein
MLLTIAMAVEAAQNCPKTICLRNFGIPPKIEILIFFKKKIMYIEEAPK